MKKSEKHEFRLPNVEEEKTVLKTVRIKLSTLNEIKKLSDKSNVSINRLINECIEFALANLNTEDIK